MSRFIIHNCEQRSEEWRQVRLGRLTGSCANDMLKTVDKGEAAGRRNLRTRLVLERITGVSQENDFCSADMQHGIDTEDGARAAYEAVTGRFVERVGFLQHPDLMAGCSPDGVIADFNGVLSIKCPKSATHLDFVETGKIPLEYERQNLHEFWITGAEWLDFLSFHPKFPEPIRQKLVRVHANPRDIAAYELAVRLFLNEVDAKVQAVQVLMQRESQVA